MEAFSIFDITCTRGELFELSAELTQPMNDSVDICLQVTIYLFTFYYSAVALLATQSAVLATAIPSVRLSVSHTLVLYPDE